MAIKLDESGNFKYCDTNSYDLNDKTDSYNRSFVIQEIKLYKKWL